MGIYFWDWKILSYVKSFYSLLLSYNVRNWLSSWPDDDKKWSIPEIIQHSFWRKSFEWCCGYYSFLSYLLSYQQQINGNRCSFDMATNHVIPEDLYCQCAYWHNNCIIHYFVDKGISLPFKFCYYWKLLNFTFWVPFLSYLLISSLFWHNFPIKLQHCNVILYKS